jgi:short-subunit dehydrogenase
LPRRNLKALYGDGWAVITGASDGLGKQYAIELAKSGFKIVLLGRNRAKLDAVAQFITSKYGVEVRTIVFDFSCLYSVLAAQELEAKLDQIDGEISILINNVGGPQLSEFSSMSFEQCFTLIKVNMSS